ncbi:unnamed protein product [Mycetohabitans rhizoxinica HKI 454]|uniref:Uncharacterized protein n=1 Tax=Mycetohabitans rhizoxinica (strain DSM 19002 / CIP 109453 / HKI 454) TaxID=882378 RepID=E5ARX1_MYCRK|nr:unnamed protein product [Mycetohabitans rhizoxinica HKI 454]
MVTVVVIVLSVTKFMRRIIMSRIQNIVYPAAPISRYFFITQAAV